jgi:H+/gluconate symporter-like permease
MPASRRDLSPLAIANLVFVATILFHGADHIRQGTGRLTTEVSLGGAVLAVMAFSTLSFTLTRHPRAPLVAAVVGLWTAVAVSAAHILPHWSAFSDSYTTQVNADGLSWVAMLSEVLAALVFGVLGLRELRREAAAPPGAGVPRPLRSDAS